MNREEILEKINNRYYDDFDAEYPTTKRYKEDAILNEDLTIRENRELVKKLNEERDAIIDKYNKAMANKEREFQDDICSYLIKETSLTLEQLQKCCTYVDLEINWARRTEYLDDVESLAKFVNSLNEKDEECEYDMSEYK